MRATTFCPLTISDRTTDMSETLPPTPEAVERLFPFVLRARILLVGRETLHRSKSKLHFVLITTDLSENSRKEILVRFAHYPVVQLYTSDQLQKFFGIQGAKVIGFRKSSLAQSIFGHLKPFRLNEPMPVASKPDPVALKEHVSPPPAIPGKGSGLGPSGSSL